MVSFLLPNILLSVVMLSVVMLNVVAPFQSIILLLTFLQKHFIEIVFPLISKVIVGCYPG